MTNHTTKAIDKALRVQSKVFAQLVDRQATINAAMQPGIDAIADMTWQSQVRAARSRRVLILPYS